MGRERTIRDEGSSICKGLAVLEGSILVHVEGIDRGGRREVAAVESQRNASVGNVSLLAIRRESETYELLVNFPRRAVGISLTIGQSEVVGDDLNSAGLEVVAIDLVAQAGRRAEVLQESVEGVCEVQLFVTGVDDNVVQRVELATEVVVEQHFYRQHSSLSSCTRRSRTYLWC